MKFKGSKKINKPRNEVVEIFKNPEYLKEYQDGFIRKDLKSGNSGEDGAVSKMYYEYSGREMELTETITSNKLPDTFESFYHHKHMDNTMKCTFTEIDDYKTLYEYEYEYIRMSWVMPRLIAILFPSVYRKQGEKWMKQFKEFVEIQ